MTWQQRAQIVLVGHPRQAREDVFEIRERVLLMALARHDERVEDRGALAGLRMTNEEPVFLVMLS